LEDIYNDSFRKYSLLNANNYISKEWFNVFRETMYDN